MEQDDRAGAIEALRRELDAGLTHVDTAEMYSSGVVEEMVGEAIAGRRDEVFLASKVFPSNAAFKRTLRACEQSLARLSVERLDLYLLHWPARTRSSRRSQRSKSWSSREKSRRGASATSTLTASRRR
jgi:diketogulonate reductase-like aldo/keto reductase